MDKETSPFIFDKYKFLSDLYINLEKLENNTKRYGVAFQINGCVKVQKFEDISSDDNTIYSVKPVRIFLGKSQVCNMTMF